LAQGVALKNPVKEGEALRWSDVGIDLSDEAVRVRREMEALFAGEEARAAG
jgi:predicted homoserine dehydrogenase-like protein